MVINTSSTINNSPNYKVYQHEMMKFLFIIYLVPHVLESLFACRKNSKNGQI